MARRGNSRSSIYISTNPLNNVPIGVPGQGVAIGRLGVLIFGRGPDAVTASGMVIDLSDGFQIDMTDQQIVMD